LAEKSTDAGTDPEMGGSFDFGHHQPTRRCDEELVGQLYEEAWKCGCKGATVYRDGSRSGVLITNTDKKGRRKKRYDFPYDEDRLIRPKELKCEVVRFQNNKDKWIAFVGLKDGRPYEIFTGLG
jgi:ribonucleoside-diphosphate reductase alpha chain